MGGGRGHKGFTNGFTNECTKGHTTQKAQQDSQQDSRKRIHQGFHPGLAKETRKDSQKDSPQRDNSVTTAGKQRDNSRTTAGQQQDNIGTPAGQQRKNSGRTTGEQPGNHMKKAWSGKQSNRKTGVRTNRHTDGDRQHAIRQSNPQEAVRRTTARQQRDNRGTIHGQGDTTGFTNAMRQSLRIPTTTTIRDRHDLDFFCAPCDFQNQCAA